MNNKLIFTCLLLLAISLTSYSMQKKPNKLKKDSTEFKFTDTKVNASSSVKNQNKSGTCWVFSGLGFFENEIMKKGKPEVDLSEMYIVHKCYYEKALKYVRMHGKINFAPGGSVTDIPTAITKFGLVPDSIYRGLNYGTTKHVHGELDETLLAYLDAIIKNPNRKLSTAWAPGVNAILDTYLGKTPESFVWEGKEYTPQTYAESLGLDMNDYISLTSFTHHPFYDKFIIEVPDNWWWGEYYNIPLNELQQTVDNAIENGYTIYWAADISEGGFKYKEGYALMPKGTDENDLTDSELSKWVELSDKEKESKRYDFSGPVPEIEVTQENRQEGFDNYETQDDHGMVIVGTAVDQKGNKYYKVKNSWDTTQKYKGYFYVSVPYFLAKTISLIVNKNAVPSEILSKINIK